MVDVGLPERVEPRRPLSDHPGDLERVVPRGHHRPVIDGQLGGRAVGVDPEVVDDRFHGERQRVLQFTLRGRHDFLQAPLSALFLFRRKNETHAAAGHPAQHPKSPEIISKFGAHPVDQGLRVKRAGPRNDGLDRPLEIPRRHAANGAHVALLERGQNLIEDGEGFLPSAPFRLRSEQVLLGYHFENRPDILSHSTVHQHKTLLQMASRLARSSRLIENAVLRQGRVRSAGSGRSSRGGVGSPNLNDQFR